LNTAIDSFKLIKPAAPVNVSLTLPASKSISNRLLIIQAFCKEKFQINNLSEADDTNVLFAALEQLKTGKAGTFDIGLAGTAFRFLTAYLSAINGEFLLTGDERIKQRPVKALVQALQTMGAKIEYVDKEGFAPLKINGNTLSGAEINIKGDISSQFISALMLIAPTLQNGLTIIIEGEFVSRPYVAMTVKLMAMFGIEINWSANKIIIPAVPYNINGLPSDEQGNKFIEVEGDWTAGSYWCAITALSPGSIVQLNGMKQSSIQGDCIVPALFSFFGVSAEFTDAGCILKHNGKFEERFGFDFTDNPDLTQTVAVVVSVLKIPCLMNGLKTLRDKETNRIDALKEQLNKIGVKVTEVENDGLFIDPSSLNIPAELPINTYNDHRMAMAFAPLVLFTDKMSIENPMVVSKSYPSFWKHLSDAGFKAF